MKITGVGSFLGKMSGPATRTRVKFASTPQANPATSWLSPKKQFTVYTTDNSGWLFDEQSSGNRELSPKKGDFVAGA